MLFLCATFTPLDKCKGGEHVMLKLHCILDSEHSRNQRKGSEFFYGGGFYEMVSLCPPQDQCFYCDNVGLELTMSAL